MCCFNVCVSVQLLYILPTIDTVTVDDKSLLKIFYLAK